MLHHLVSSSSHHSPPPHLLSPLFIPANLICSSPRSGGLPPNARKQQALLFNNPHDSGEVDARPYNVLVASDAIGMGLNLSIRRIIFSTLTKFDGKEFRSLNSSVGALPPSLPPSLFTTRRKSNKSLVVLGDMEVNTREGR
jgi:hypothetical protein